MKIMMHISRVLSTAVALLLATACSSSTPATSPAVPTAPTPPSGPSFTLTGRVIDGASGLPIAGAQVGVQVPVGPGVLQSTPSDASGRYQLTWSQPGWNATAWVAAGKNNDYVSPCAAAVRMDRDGTIDLQLISRTSLTAQLSLTGRPGTRSVSGVTFRTTAAGRQVVSGASVAFEGWSDSPFAWTTSDWMGRYHLCGLPSDQTVEIWAVQTTGVNFDPSIPVSSVNVEAGPDVVVDIELK